jgi:hypothetical protein
MNGDAFYRFFGRECCSGIFQQLPARDDMQIVTTLCKTKSQVRQQLTRRGLIRVEVSIYEYKLAHQKSTHEINYFLVFHSLTKEFLTTPATPEKLQIPSCHQTS